jgi:hypothetical protein
MKKKKKVLLIVLSVLFILFVAEQFYCIYSCQGNLNFLIYNEYAYTMESDDNDLDTAHIEIYIDGNKVVNDTLIGIYNSYSIMTTFRNHTAVIKVNGEVSKEIKFNTILWTSIYVEIRRDARFDWEEYRERFDISISKCPIIFLS